MLCYIWYDSASKNGRGGGYILLVIIKDKQQKITRDCWLLSSTVSLFVIICLVGAVSMAGHSSAVELKDIMSYRNLVHAVAGATVSAVKFRSSWRERV